MKILQVIVFALILMGCTKSAYSPSEEKIALSVRGNAGEMVLTRASVDLPVSTQVGVYVLETGATPNTFATTTYKNVLYKATGSSGQFTSESPALLHAGKSYKACAYGPALSGTPTDAAAIAFAHGLDVVYAPLTDVTISGPSASAALTFVHKMSQIKFTLNNAPGTPDLTGATLNVTGFNQSCTLNLSDGSVTPVTGSGAFISLIDQPVCFVPSSSPMTLTINVTLSNNRVFSGTITRQFTPSSSYSYSVSLKNDMELQISCSVVDWSPVNGGSADVGI
jgi:hypothetical protein